ncbi:MAG: radical SAM protein, partial [Candidatus Omnitrophica bacterium]|nr:radical SAM protein [Candidatus Omnitrophota bacterium]
DWIEKICDLIIQKNLKIKLTGLAVPRGDMDLKLLLKMKKAGFYRLEYGIESGSDKILKAMGKNFKSEDAKKTLALTKKSGIQNVAYFIVGFPTEDDIEFQKTLDFIKENKANIDFVKSVNPLFLMSGSEIFSNPDRFNIETPQDNSDIYWSIGSSNNFDVRMGRVKSTHKLLKELGIAYTTEATALPEQKYDITLVTTPPWGIENPPVGLAYLAEYLKCHGYRCAVFDLNVEFYNAVGDNLKHLWHVENKNFWRDAEWLEILLSIFDREIEKYINKILQTGSPIIGFSVVDPKERITIEFIRRIKAKDRSRRIILGGPATLTAHARKIFLDQLGDKIDYFVIGEGEDTLVEIMKKNCQGPIPGTIAIKESKELEYLKRPQIKDLDCIPYPSYNDFNLKCYPGNSLILEWSRGCISQCAFCINHQLIQGYRARSAGHIFNELKYHNNINKISYFTICDPILNGSPKTLDKLCSLIMENSLNINWTGEVIPREDMDIALLKKMREAGCFKLQIGLESGSNKVLKDMKKPYTAAIAENFLKKSSLAGIETEMFIMVGFPTEEESHFQETIDFVIRNQHYIDTIKSINTLHLIAGTEVYNDYSKYGIKELPDKNWHYLWQAEKGNSYSARKERGERLLELAKELGIKVMETNLNEGKQQQEQNPSLSNLKLLVNKLQDLPERKKELHPGATMPRKRLCKAPYLAIILTLTILAELYLWALKKIRNIVIFPDS